MLVGRIPTCDTTRASSAVPSREYSDCIQMCVSQLRSPQEARRASLDRLRALITEAGDGCRRRLVVADDTMHYKSMRHECRQIARQGALLEIAQLDRSTVNPRVAKLSQFRLVLLPPPLTQLRFHFPAGAAFCILWVRADPAVARARNRCALPKRRAFYLCPGDHRCVCSRGAVCERCNSWCPKSAWKGSFPCSKFPLPRCACDCACSQA